MTQSDHALQFEKKYWKTLLSKYNREVCYAGWLIVPENEIADHEQAIEVLDKCGMLKGFKRYVEQCFAIDNE